jgi:hypothetical protein
VKKKGRNRMKEINFLACAIYDLEVSPEHTEEKGGEKKNKEGVSFHP